MYPARAGFLSLELEYGSSTIMFLCSLILSSAVHIAGYDNRCLWELRICPLKQWLSTAYESQTDKMNIGFQIFFLKSCGTNCSLQCISNCK